MPSNAGKKSILKIGKTVKIMNPELRKKAGNNWFRLRNAARLAKSNDDHSVKVWNALVRDVCETLRIPMIVKTPSLGAIEVAKLASQITCVAEGCTTKAINCGKLCKHHLDSKCLSPWCTQQQLDGEDYCGECLDAGQDF